MQIFNSNELDKNELKKILQKPMLDEVTLGEGAKNKIKETFGKEMTAQEVVKEIILNIKQKGDEAVFYYTKIIDNTELNKDTLVVSEAEINAAFSRVSPDLLDAVKTAIANVEKFHVEQLPKSWFTEREFGSLLGQKYTPVDRVGIYVPGGTAVYPSSVIMNAVPARVAGVKEIIMVSPPAKDGTLNDLVLVAAKLAGVTKIFKVGGAQAIAALAFGTETIPKADKITGPGNIFVTLAKKEVYGYADIDMLAGPSEILIIADETADPSYVAADMLSQVEHDVLASSILVTTSSDLAKEVTVEIEKQLAKLPRQEIAKTALDKNSLIIIAKNLEEAAEFSNEAAPEHLEILTAEPFALLPFIKHAGAIFLGKYSPEPLGDYIAGPNHVLPTGGSARFYSVLNVETFMKKSSIISYTEKALSNVSDKIINLALAEGLDAHANAVKIRCSKGEK
ncbi:histidinol dehydrogenase [Selenomonadales bacterium OttesenSCG-928-I06]|nr:histidinol dehydrogenase [Selenomonadales bacterium OttesenSCG-928-I06]